MVAAGGTFRQAHHPTRYGITIGCNLDLERGRCLGERSARCGSGDISRHGSVSSRSYKKYFCDMNSSTWAAATDIIGMLPPFAAKYGLWDVDYSSGYYFVDHWQLA